ncbi:MAG: bifunctional DNA-formamidopyrimidine glycosylase/DNA-(apurinic or apyrimidinic site) lyase [Patescibacteria group bacterium]|jgi:formamidopyrimidine-DNA glycosylase
MPELPEVETIRRGLEIGLSDSRITTVDIISPKSALPNAAFLKRELAGRKISGFKRRGKLLILTLSPKKGADYLLIHLRMTGQLIYSGPDSEVIGGHSIKDDAQSRFEAVGGNLPNRHTRIIINFKDGGRLFFNDLRKFGYLKLVSESELKSVLSMGYGPEPLTKEFTLDYLKNIFQHKKTKIKALLLNQKIVAGLGNIYVDESLWSAKIRPGRLVGKISIAEIKRLYLSINKIIKRAIEHQGTTFSNYLDSRGKTGNFSDFLQVYGRKGQKCRRCGGIIKKEKLAGRGTHYCPDCQK